MSKLICPEFERPRMLSQKSSQLAALARVIEGDEFEHFNEDVQESIRMLSSELASQVRKLLRQVEKQLEIV